MSDFLKKIVEKTLEDVENEKALCPPGEMKEKALSSPHAVRNFAEALKKNSDGKKPVRIIAELKKASPSRGLIRSDFPCIELARSLERSGAAALSVLTERNYFLGAPESLERVSGSVSIPVLRKDFILDEYQIYQSRAIGADAVLLIAALLEDSRFRNLYRLARSLGLHVLAEAHNEEEMKRILRSGAEIIGINARNLKSFRTDVSESAALLRAIPPDRIRVAESGVMKAEDLLERESADAFLIGELLMRAPSPAGPGSRVRCRLVRKSRVLSGDTLGISALVTNPSRKAGPCPGAL